jgi:hypothetical protein
VDYEVVGRVKSLMKSLILRIGFFPTGKLLKNRLVLHFSEQAFNTVSFTECFMDPFEAKGF